MSMDLTGSGRDGGRTTGADFDDPFEELARLLDEPITVQPKPAQVLSHAGAQSGNAGPVTRPDASVGTPARTERGRQEPIFDIGAAAVASREGEPQASGGVDQLAQDQSDPHDAISADLAAEFAAAMDVELGEMTTSEAAKPVPSTGAADARTSSYGRWIGQSQEAAPAVAVSASSGRGAAPKPDAAVADEFEVALRGLSAPANPRDTVIHRSEPFAPARTSEPGPVVAPAKVFDDFDELIASELAAMQQSQEVPAAAQDDLADYESVWQPEEGEAAAEETERSASSDHDRWFEPGETGRGARSARGSAGVVTGLRPRRSLGAGVAFGAIAAVLAAGTGVYWLSGGTSSLTGSKGVLIVEADKDPVKVKPDDPGGRNIPNQNKAVYERVESASADMVPSQRKLVTSEERPMDLPAEEPSPSDLPGVEFGTIASAQAAEPVQVASASDDNEPIAVLTPRRVRTLTVRPDGTLVAADTVPETSMDALKNGGALIEASARPVSVETLGEGQVPGPAATAAEAASASSAAEDVAAGDPVVGQPAPGMPVPGARPRYAPAAPADVVTAAAYAPTAPAVPAAEQAPAAPVARTDSVETASLETPAPSAQAAASGSVPVVSQSSGYYVQISSQPSEPLAQQSSQRLGQRFSSVIDGRQMVIQPADIPGKGTYYRVRIAAASKDEASRLCDHLKSAGGSCFVSH
ncbi:SPOR domain-containing protein [Aurantimonas sp. VKM B-3413]|uniref:SPOR domain-containing protein n=1 Tax=Aurantimonas sp. VKM B-3413 TaxID=2779401 RepID=UPI001E3FD9E2|nr:SPOR domain-containing protein [Aurantimonas sp. VKM B-3413]MCB8836673.1 SPOR domain-containing protein [Aurantimonas sp. VKM B-3413]